MSEANLKKLLELGVGEAPTALDTKEEI